MIGSPGGSRRRGLSTNLTLLAQCPLVRESSDGATRVDSVAFDVSGEFYPSAVIDVYVWGDDGGAPGEVLSFAEGVLLENIPLWPGIGRDLVGLAEPVAVGPAWWVGFWGHWVDSMAQCFIGADLDGAGGGESMTNIAPGQELPQGWHNVDLVWGATAALGIGAVVDSCPPTPAENTTWASIKALYR